MPKPILEINEIMSLFHEQINQLGKIGLTEKGFKLNESKRRQIRKKMKELPFRGKTLDFLCWISTQVIAYELRNSSRNTINEIVPALKTISYRYDMRNMLRLFRRFPGYFLDAIRITDVQRGELISRIHILYDEMVLEEKRLLKEQRAAEERISILDIKLIPKEMLDTLAEIVKRHGFKTERIDEILLKGQFSKQ